MNDTPTPQPSPKASALSMIIVLVAIGIATWFCFAEIWPVNALIDWQDKVFDGHYVKLTFMVTFLIILLPMLGIQWIVKRMMGKNEE